MMESLNEFATGYAGLLAIVGLVLAVGSTVAAVYFYYNPRQSDYKFSYKTFSRGFFSNGLRRIGNVLKKEEDQTFPVFVDLWNSGANPISSDVIREPITLALQSSAVSKGIEIRKVEVVRESHPGVSGFGIELDDGAAKLVWTHFDPEMAVRVRMETTQPLSADQIAVFGQGLRLTFKRVRNLSDIGGAASLSKNVIMIGVPIVAVVAIGGWALRWLTTQGVVGMISYLYFIALFVSVVILVLGAVMLGAAINSIIEWAFNTRSPIEKIEGEPSLRFSSEEERIAYFEEHRADIAFRTGGRTTAMLSSDRF